MNGVERQTITGINHGTPPVALLQQQARLRALEKDEDEPLPTQTNGQVRQMEPDPVVPSPASRPSLRSPVVRVSLEYLPPSEAVPSFTLEFDVGEVCVQENYISLLVVGDLGFKPSTTMQFNLTAQGKTYRVIFAGAEFEFKTVKVRGISFLRDRKAEAQ